MRFYPFSKKAINIMLATALVITPLAATAPIGGGVVQAATVDQQIDQLANRMIIFYERADGGKLNTAKRKIDSYTIVGDAYPSKVTTVEERDAFIDIIKEIGKLVYTKQTSATFAQNVKNFRTNQSPNFQELFDGAVTTEDMIDFFAAMEQELNSVVFIQDLLSGTYQNAIQNVVTNTKQKGQFSELDGVLTEKIGVGLNGLFAYDTSFNNHVDKNGDARSELLKSGFSADGRSTLTVNGNKNVNVEQIINFRANYQIFNIDLEGLVTWKVTRNGSSVAVTGHKFTPTQAGTYKVTAHLNNEPNLRIAERTIEITDPDAGDGAGGGAGGGGGATPAPPVDPTPEVPAPEVPTPEIPARPGTPADATETGSVERETSSTGQVKAVTKVDGAKLAEVVAANPAADRVGFKVERAVGEAAELRLPKQAVEALRNAENKNLVIDVDSEDGSVSLPVNELSDDKLRKALQLDADADVDFDVSITVAPVAKAEADAIKGSLQTAKKGAVAKSEVIDFSMTVRSGDREVALDRFSTYIFREIPVTGLTNPEFAVVYNVTGDVPVAVPTQAGTERVRFGSRTFSKYVVVEREPVAFSDLKEGFWAKPEIDRLSVRDIFQGRADGKVGVGEDVTRAQLAVLLSRSLALIADNNYDGQFTDVKGQEWYMGEFLPTIEAGIVRGRSDGTFAANDPVTRQQAAAMISRAMESMGFDEAKLGTAKAKDSYSDYARIDEYAKADVERVLQAGIMEGRNNGEFDPKAPMTRAQMARVLDSLLKFQGLMN